MVMHDYNSYLYIPLLHMEFIIVDIQFNYLNGAFNGSITVPCLVVILGIVNF